MMMIAEYDYTTVDKPKGAENLQVYNIYHHMRYCVGHAMEFMYCSYTHMRLLCKHMHIVYVSRVHNRSFLTPTG